MRTLEFLPTDRQKRIATETRDLYAPLAHRFGMARVRWELEDLAFKHLEPAEYKTLAKKVATRRAEREKAIAQRKEPLESHLRKAGIANVEVTGRPKHLWSIQKKMKKWFRQVLELQLDAKTPDEFLEFLKLDLYQDEIFVFTPTGDVIQLPKGATPIDFAFAVHTEVGLHCQGARINGRIASLARELKNSETVEIITSPSAKPSRDWLAHVRTGRARHKIRQRLRIEEHATSIKLGREILDREIKRRRLTKPDDSDLVKVAKTLHLTDLNHLIASIGQGDVNVSQVLRELYPETDGVAEAPKPGPLDWLVDKVRGTTKGVRIQGVDGMMVRYAQW